MRKDYGKVKAFRLDKHDERLLDRCFDMLNLSNDSFNAKMSSFINRVHKDIEELIDLRKKVEEQRNEINELNMKLSNSVVPLEEKEESNIIEQEQPSKNEQLTPTKTAKSSDSLIWCPFYEEWISENKCSQCSKENFKRFSECFAARNRIRIGKGTQQDTILLKPTKPRP